MNNRIKVLSIILGVVYVLAIGFSMSDGIMGFMIGLKHDPERAERKDLVYDFISVNVVPESYTFPGVETNLKTGEQVSVISQGYLVKLKNPVEGRSTGMIVYRVVGMFFSFVLLVAMLYMPFLFFSILKSITKNKFIDDLVIKRIIRIGWILVGVFLIKFLIFNIGDTWYARSLLKIENYKIVIDFSNSTFLFLGIVTLLLSEILKLSLKMKEDQDLTI